MEDNLQSSNGAKKIPLYSDYFKEHPIKNLIDTKGGMRSQIYELGLNNLDNDLDDSWKILKEQLHNPDYGIHSPEGKSIIAEKKEEIERFHQQMILDQQKILLEQQKPLSYFKNHPLHQKLIEDKFLSSGYQAALEIIENIPEDKSHFTDEEMRAFTHAYNIIQNQFLGIPSESGQEIIQKFIEENNLENEEEIENKNQEDEKVVPPIKEKSLTESHTGKTFTPYSFYDEQDYPFIKDIDSLYNLGKDLDISNQPLSKIYEIIVGHIKDVFADSNEAFKHVEYLYKSDLFQKMILKNNFDPHAYADNKKNHSKCVKIVKSIMATEKIFGDMGTKPNSNNEAIYPILKSVNDLPNTIDRPELFESLYKDTENLIQYFIKHIDINQTPYNLSVNVHNDIFNQLEDIDNKFEDFFDIVNKKRNYINSQLFLKIVLHTIITKQLRNKFNNKKSHVNYIMNYLKRMAIESFSVNNFSKLSTRLILQKINFKSVIENTYLNTGKDNSNSSSVIVKGMQESLNYAAINYSSKSISQNILQENEYDIDAWKSLANQYFSMQECTENIESATFCLPSDKLGIKAGDYIMNVKSLHNEENYLAFLGINQFQEYLKLEKDFYLHKEESHLVDKLYNYQVGKVQDLLKIVDNWFDMPLLLHKNGSISIDGFNPEGLSFLLGEKNYQMLRSYIFFMFVEKNIILDENQRLKTPGEALREFTPKQPRKEFNVIFVDPREQGSNDIIKTNSSYPKGTTHDVRFKRFHARLVRSPITQKRWELAKENGLKLHILFYPKGTDPINKDTTSVEKIRIDNLANFKEVTAAFINAQAKAAQYEIRFETFISEHIKDGAQKNTLIIYKYKTKTHLSPEELLKKNSD